MLGKLVAHDELLVFITGVDYNLFRVVMFEDVLDEVVSKRPCSAGDEDGFVGEHKCVYCMLLEDVNVSVIIVF